MSVRGGNVYTGRSIDPIARRWFLSRFGATFAATGAALTAAGVRLRAQSSTISPWQPARHAQDDWLSQASGIASLRARHDKPDGFSNALNFANNYFTANRASYGLNDSDLAVLVVARHNSTQFAYSDAIWTKYRAELVKAAGVTEFPDVAERLNALLKRGVHLAVCQMANTTYRRQHCESHQQQSGQDLRRAGGQPRRQRAPGGGRHRSRQPRAGAGLFAGERGMTIREQMTMTIQQTRRDILRGTLAAAGLGMLGHSGVGAAGARTGRDPGAVHRRAAGLSGAGAGESAVQTCERSTARSRRPISSSRRSTTAIPTSTRRRSA